MNDSLSKKLTFNYGSSEDYKTFQKIFTDLQNEKFGVYFNFSDMLYSATANRLRLKNEPTEAQFENLCILLMKVLYPARISTGVPLHVNSAFRSVPLNTAVGGVKSSRHLQGLAADIWCCDMQKLWRNLESLPHKELIQYKSFIHVAL